MLKTVLAILALALWPCASHAYVLDGGMSVINGYLGTGITEPPPYDILDHDLEKDPCVEFISREEGEHKFTLSGLWIDYDSDSDFCSFDEKPVILRKGEKGKACVPKCEELEKHKSRVGFTATIYMD